MTSRNFLFKFNRERKMKVLKNLFIVLYCKIFIALRIKRCHLFLSEKIFQSLEKNLEKSLLYSHLKKVSDNYKNFYLNELKYKSLPGGDPRGPFEKKVDYCCYLEKPDIIETWN